MVNRTASNKAFWLVAWLGLAALLTLRFSHQYASDKPLGIALGIATLFLAVLTVLAGALRKGPSRLARFARDVHVPLGVMTLALAIAHWHFRGRDYMGISSAALLVLFVTGLSHSALRKRKFLRLTHKYGGYAFIVLAAVHGLRALFFPAN